MINSVRNNVAEESVSVSGLIALVARLDQRVSELDERIDCLERENLGLRNDVGYWKTMHAKAKKREALGLKENERLRAEIRKLNAKLFGRSSEKQSSKDRSNDLDDPRDPLWKTKRQRGQQKDRPGPRRRDYTHLPAREEIRELPIDERRCPRCGRPFAERGDTEDSEQIEIEVVTYRRVIRRKRYRRTCACSDCRRTLTAPAPAKLIPKSRSGTSVWIEVLLDKFHGHRATGRLLAQLRLHELDLAAGTVTGGLKRLEPLLAPIYEAFARRNRLSVYNQADETRWLVFIEQAGKLGHLWWLWTFLGEDTIVYRLDPTRSHRVPEGHFPEQAAGVLMVDRYSAYKAMAQVKAGTLKLAFCWAHVRRDFVTVGKGWPELKDWALDWLRKIRQLYRLNRPRRRHPPSSAAFREADTLLGEQVEEMRRVAAEQLADPRLRAPLRQKLDSLQKHWLGLTLFVDDSRIPMDNNASERTLRGPALGRKNYYGSGSVWSGRLAVTMFSILATLELWNLNPRRWLTWYFDACAVEGGQSPGDIEPFLPWNLTANRRAALSFDSQPPTPSPT